MIIPKFWAEARIQHREEGKQVTVRKLGWSSLDQEDAQANADRRAAEAMQRILGGEKLGRRDQKAAYGVDGVPIREEIVAEHGSVVVTRNCYGALCLNTPDVLFADVDFNEGPPAVAGCVTGVLLLAAIYSAGVTWGSGWKFFWLACVCLIAGIFISRWLHEVFSWLTGGPEKRARMRIEAFLAARPDWRVRLYRTPAGYRVLAVHRTFTPDHPEVEEFFRAVHTDPLYSQLCRKQQCFRARITPKPWRVGVPAMRPRRAVWPVSPEMLPIRREWIADYETKSAGHAACRFVAEMGNGSAHPPTLMVQRIHDEVCRAESGLPIA